jgi:two-component system chemotaxis sensor kinase CheA
LGAASQGGSGAFDPPGIGIREPNGRTAAAAAAGAGDDSVYRYDRAGLLSALEARMAGKGR